MQPIVIFEILLLVAVIAGIFIPWDRRSGEERRGSSRGGRREADDMQSTHEPAPR